MDSLCIQKSIVSVTAPGSHLEPGDDHLGRQLARECNNFMASIVKAHPLRFGFFASLPLPDIEGSLREIDYAINVLGADGIGLMSNSHGIYPGDSTFEAIFQRLDTLGAKVFIHPNHCRYAHVAGSFQKIPELLPVVPSSILEYFFDTGRALTSLLHSGTAAAHPNVTFIIAHCGAILPLVLEKITGFATKCLNMRGLPTSEDVRADLNRHFFFDTAGFMCPDQLPAILKLVTPDRLLFGTDLPFLPFAVAKDLSQELDDSIQTHCGQQWLSDVYCLNAEKLLRRE
ncbi:hypothetical protein LTR84_004449 [Exophiala bonariae]|uniref:6-methylsalicylate decarboxylase n=1 Tax=Exophiala bonariae TaxID=1690606 RepID=A0AAV9N5H7_9EURO|nr:hypothetical protein LTR84_004449 [Exophiala bonariae]